MLQKCERRAGMPDAHLDSNKSQWDRKTTSVVAMPRPESIEDTMATREN